MRRIYGSAERWRGTYGVPIKSWEDIESLDNPLKGYISAARQREDKEAYLRLICDRWHQVYCETIRRYDPSHLILGDRNTLHLQPPPRPWAFHIMRRYLDVLAVRFPVNNVGPSANPYSFDRRPIRLPSLSSKEAIYASGIRVFFSTTLPPRS